MQPRLSPIPARRILVAALIAAALLCINSASAQTAIGATWDNTGSEWTNGASWVGDNAPTNIAATNATVGVGNVATFSNAAVGNNTVNLSVSREIYGLLFTTGANAYTFTGSNLTMNGAYGISNLSSTVQTFNNKILNSQASGIVGSFTAGGSLVFDGGIDLSATSANRTVTFGGIGNITVGSVIANGGTATIAAVTITNQGLTLFSGNNTYGGLTTVSSGSRLQLGNAGALGSTVGLTRVSSGGAIDLNGQSILGEGLTNSGTGVSSSGSLYNSSASAATWSGNITPSADSTIEATNGLITLSGGIDLNNNAATSRTLTLEGAGGIVVSGNISNSFAGSTGGLAIGGTNGTFTLSGSNSYTGPTTLSNTYTLRVTSVDALSSKSSLEGASAAARTPTLDLATAGNYKMNSYQGGNMLLLATNGASSLTFTNTGTGNLVVGGSRTITATNVAVTFDGSLDISPTTAVKTFTVAGNSDYTFNGSILTTNTAFSSEFRASSTGTTTLNASNNHDGLTTVSAGSTLRLANSFAMGVPNGLTNAVASGGALQLQGGITINGEILALNGRGISDNGALRNVSGNNTYNGLIELNSTNRINSDAGTLTLGAFTNGLSSSRQLIIGGAGNTVMSAAFGGTGSGRLVKDGTGTLTISGANTVNGGVLVSAGTLRLDGSHGSDVSIDGSNSVLGATLVNSGWPVTSGGLAFSNGGKVSIYGTPTNVSYTLITASNGITGTPVLATAVSGYQLAVSGNSLLLIAAAGSPSVVVSGSFTAFSATVGSPSFAQTVTASGSDLTADLVVTPPAGYELSTDGTTYSASISLAPSGGAVASTTIYVRLTGAAAGVFSGSVSFASTGATTQDLPVSGAVATAYATWASGYGLSGSNAATGADPDSDGFNNNSEYCFDGNPTNSTPYLFKVTAVDTNAVFNWIERNSGVAYLIETNSSLTNVWTGPAAVTVSNAASQSGVLLTNDYTRKEFTVPASGKNFYRIKATVSQ